MTTKEKAKRYDEVINRMKYYVVDEYGCSRIKVADVFPELKESEDERIRKSLIELFKDMEWDDSILHDYNMDKDKTIAWLEKQGDQKPTDKIQLGKEYKCIASPRYSTFSIDKIYKPEDKFLCRFMNLCSDCFEPIEDSERNDLASNTNKVEPKFKVGDIIHCKLDNRTFVIKEVDLKKGVYIYTEKGYGNDINYADEMFELVEPNPYSGTSFVYNNHTWGMCARDGGVDILCDSKLIKHIGEQKPTERKDFILVSFGTDIKLENDTIIIPEGCVATIDGNKIHIKREGKSALEAINEEKVDNANKVEPKFEVGDWVVRKDGGFFRDNRKFIQIIDIVGEKHWFDTGTYLKSKNIRLWSIEDAQDGDVLAISWWQDKNLWEKIIIFKKYHNEGIKWLCNSPCVEGYGNTFKNGKLVFNEEVPFFSKTWTCNLHPATKEQCDLLFKSMKEKGYEWDVENKKLTSL